MSIRVLIPSHFESELGAKAAALGVELVPYDREGIPQSDSSGARVLFRWWITAEQGDEMIRRHPLEWIHTGSAGVDHILTPLFQKSSITLTNSAGVHATSIAEWVVAEMLSIIKDLPAMAERQRRRLWEKVERPELTGQQAVFLGAGEISRAIANRLLPFGIRLHAVRKSAGPDPLFTRVFGPESIVEAARTADWLIVAAPLTSATRHLVGSDVLRALPSRARVINVSRGAVVDEGALIDALREGEIAGAVLDVFEDEPLRGDHPLWALPGVTVLPHTTWRSPQVHARQVNLFLENLERFVRGEALRNRVDVAAGY